MTAEQTTGARLGGADVAWLPGAVAGIVAGAGMAVVLHYQLFVLPMFGLFVGLGSLVGGLLVHGVVSVGFAVPFVTAARRTTEWPAGDRRGVLVALGVAYGGLLWLVGFGIGVPVLTRLTSVRSVGVPYLPMDALVAHLVYGLLLGIATVVLVSPSHRADRG